MFLLDEIARHRLSRLWGRYLFASVLTGVTLLVTLLLLGLQSQVIVASMGATAFIVIAMPKSRAADTGKTIGGQAIGLLCGSLASLIPHAGLLSNATIFALAVASCAFLMLVTRYKHPPAAGTALGIADIGVDPLAIFTVIGSTLIISFIRILFLNLAPRLSSDE